MGICCMTQGKQNRANNLEGWDGVGGRREVPEGEDVCMPMGSLHCCTAEINTML